MERVSESCELVELLKREVVPALGCTEPIAVALCAAKSARLLGGTPDKIELFLSANILKNAMGVGIPGSDEIGLPIAVAMGVVGGDPERGLEVLDGVTAQQEAQARGLIESGAIEISLKDGDCDKLYVEVVSTLGDVSSKVVIASQHTNFVYMSVGDEVLLDCLSAGSDSPCNQKMDLSMKQVYDFATQVELSKIEFILEAARLNRAAAEESFKGNYGHSLGRLFIEQPKDGVMGQSTFSRILAYTSAACDARMAGAQIPVMSNSGSGNQGVAATLPVVIYAQDNNASNEQLIRALTLSHLTAIYIKQQLGRLSALCGCVIAATGSSCGITYLMGGEYTQVCHSVKNMIANLTGMICDGAKPSCALKLSSGVSTAVMSAMMAKENRVVSAIEGIIDEDVDLTIRNLTTIGTDGMQETDRLVLKIMTSK